MTTIATSEYEILGQAVRAIAAQCDGAHTDDGVGFNASDTTFGRSVAVLPESEWDQDVAAAVYTLLRKYKGQLGSVGIDFDSIPPVRTGIASGGRRRAIRAASNTLAVAGVSRKSRLTLDHGLITLESPYHADLVREVRSIPGRRWDGARGVNTFPASSAASVRDLADKWHISVPDDIADLADTPQDEIPQPAPELGLEIDGDLVIIRFAYAADLVTDVKKNVPGAKWNVAKRVWVTVTANLHQALEFAERHNLTIQPGLVEFLTELEAKANELREASRATDADIHVESALPLKPYQRAGVAYALRTRNCIIGDKMGLGKTVQALAAVIHDNALPCIIVTTNTGKLNWVREISKFFPSFSTEVVCGTTSEPVAAADFVIINYEIVAARADDLIDINPVGLILDESHYIKNAKPSWRCPECNAKVRSNAKTCKDCNKAIVPVERWNVLRGGGVMKISRAISATGMKILLTGTPITSRPIELIPQLDAIDRLGEFDGRWKFQQRYCGRDGQGAFNLVELNEKMRGSFYIRRTLEDVMDEVPALTNAPQSVQISTAGMRKYQEIERDVVHYLADRARELAESEAAEKAASALGLDVEDVMERAAVQAAGRRAYAEKAMRAEAAEHLVRINALKTAVSELKYEGAVTWIEEFLNNSDGKLIVFGEHISVVEDLVAHFGDLAVKVRGGVSVEDRDAAQERFQTDPTCRLFIANMDAAGEVLTLTAAYDVAFVEQAWTPTKHAQCVGRAYGRVSDLHPVTAWYLLAPGTIDEDINAMLLEKAKVVDAVTDGIELDEQQTSILADLVVQLANRTERED